MEQNIFLNLNNRHKFRNWLETYNKTATECWIALKRGKPINPTIFYYIDAVEEALCFGWIDSKHKFINGLLLQKFTPRRKNSPWTELNKERVRRLERLHIMTDAGRTVLPNMNIDEFKLDADIEIAMKNANVLSIFKSFPALYQRIRAYNVSFYKKRDLHKYNHALTHLIEKTKKGQMFGEWNDYGRLLNY